MRACVSDCDLYYEDRGAGPPLLFVHGFPLSGEMWLPTVERLGIGWRCVVPDLRGHGRSGATEQVTIAQFADDLAALLDALDEQRPAVIIGLSLGGIIAFEFYRRHRNRVRALVLCDTRANAEPPEGIARREALAQSALRAGSRAVADAMIDGLFAPGAAPELKARWHAVMARTPPVGVAAAARALAQRAESFSTLPRIDCPTLVVVGAEDTLTPVESLREIHASIRGSCFEVIPGAGHLPPVEQPDRFASVLQDFLASLA
jgi:pimeloyl-ACP methyl ester carboxylesterase